MGLDTRLGLALPAMQLLAGLAASRHYRSLPRLPETGPGSAGLVSIIVPARNEAPRLPALLRSLHSLDGVDYEIIVVDDASQDETAAVARTHGASVLRVAGPPAGWSGKCYACHVGAEAATGEWLLFTDADTVHGPQSLRRALGAPGLTSLLARQRCQSFWERLLLPYAYALYFAGAARANQPGGTDIANGQYLLFDRSTYRRIGGHAAVRGSVIEDVELARRVRAVGRQVRLFRAEEELEVRMYTDLSSLWEGLSKNAFRFVCHSPRSGIRTALTGLLLGASLPLSLRRGQPRALLLAAPMLVLAPWLRRFEVPAWYLLLQPLAAAVFQLLALDSMRCTLTRSARWKGRRY